MAISNENNSPPARLEKGEIHDVLRNERRRLALETLRDDGDSIEIRELSERIAIEETGESPPPRNKRQSVYVSLHQQHLPKLDNLGIIEYDSDRKEIALRDRVRDVEVYMEVVPKYGLSWGEYYLGIGVLALLTIIAVTVGVPLVSQVGVTAWAVVYFLVIVISAAFNIRSQGRWLLDRLRS